MGIGLENLCAIVCAFNEQKTIEEVVSRTRPFAGEVVVIDDGSCDETASIAKSAGARVISHPTNYGKGRALRTGFNYFALQTQYAAAATLDADLQHKPEEIPRFVDALNDGSDIAIGMRNFDLPDVPRHRRIGNTVYAKVLSWASGKDIRDPENGFRAFKRQPLLELYSMIRTDGFTFEAEFLLATLQGRYDLGWVPISTIYIEGRESKIAPLPHLRQSTMIAWNLVSDKLFRGYI
jgi:glycosyltransferase involved in cell wall biosynthesis